MADLPLRLRTLGSPGHGNRWDPCLQLPLERVLPAADLTISEQNFTLPLGLVTLQGNLGTGSISVVLAGVILSMLPALVVFIFGQRTLREGLTAGASK